MSDEKKSSETHPTFHWGPGQEILNRADTVGLAGLRKASRGRLNPERLVCR